MKKYLLFAGAAIYLLLALVPPQRVELDTETGTVGAGLYGTKRVLLVGGQASEAAGAITIANGADVVEGGQSDPASCAAPRTVSGCLAQIDADTKTNNVTPTDCSGTITLGGTAQNAFTATATKHGFTVVNLSTDPMWISFTGTAAVGASASYLLAAGSSTAQGGSYSTPFGFGMNTALSVIAATTTDKFSCTWW